MRSPRCTLCHKPMKRITPSLFWCGWCKVGVPYLRAGKPVRAAAPVLVTIPNVPIVMAGVEYLLSSGPATFTPEDVQDFVGSQDDPAIVPPRLQLGHSVFGADGELLWPKDAWPALGKVINLWYDDETMTAVGDYVGVPRWLAEIMPIAYPNKSIEGFQHAETVTGHTWGLVVHAVALLGVVWPGCSTLEDLPILFSEEGPDDVTVYDSEGEEINVKAVAAARGRNGSPVAANVNVDDVRRAYYDSLDAGQMWWWIRAIYIAPNELIVDDDEGNLYRVPYTTSGDEVTFKDPTEVKIQFVDASAEPNRRAISRAASGGRLAATYDERAESRPNDQGGNMTPEQIQKLRANLGLTEAQLPDNADKAQIDAALGVSAETEPANPPNDPAPETDAAEKGDEEEESEGTPPDNQTQTSTAPAAQAALPPGMVAVPASEWARVQQGAQAGLQAAERDEGSRRDTALSAALQGGKIRPGDVPSYKNMHTNAASREMFYQLLTKPVAEGGLAAGLVPVTERGEVPAGDASTVAAGQEYDESWLSSQERQRIDAVKAGTFQQPTVVMDGNYNGNGG